jgi:hypothetical protein
MKPASRYVKHLLPGETVATTTILLQPRKRWKVVAGVVIATLLIVAVMIEGVVRLIAANVIAFCAFAPYRSWRAREVLQLGAQTIPLPSEVIITDHRVIVLPYGAADDADALFIGDRRNTRVNASKQLVLADAAANQAAGRIGWLNRSKVARLLATNS